MCSAYPFSVYYYALGIIIPPASQSVTAYAKNFYDPTNIKTNDVVEYYKKEKENGVMVYRDNKGNVKDIDLSNEEGKQAYARKILTEYNLQVGDILCFHSGSSGHVMLVHKIIYDESGQPINAIIRDSNGSYETKTTNISKGLSFSRITNDENNIYEGTVRERYLIGKYGNIDRSSVIDSIISNSRKYFSLCYLKLDNAMILSIKLDSTECIVLQWYMINQNFI